VGSIQMKAVYKMLNRGYYNLTQPINMLQNMKDDTMTVEYNNYE